MKYCYLVFQHSLLQHLISQQGYLKELFFHNNLLDGFLNHNKMDLSFKEQIWYWPTPTRCNPLARAQLWRMEMEDFEKKLYRRKSK